MSSALTLDQIVDDAAFLSFEHQLHLVDVAEKLGEHNWHVDLNARTLDLTGRDGVLRTTVHLLGSAAENPGTWLWGWANPSGFSAEVTALSAQVAHFGKEHNVAELAGAEHPLTPDLAARLVDAAKIITGHWTSYSGQVGPGTRAYFLIDAPELTLPPPAMPRVMRTIMQCLSTGMVRDHRRAFTSYARLRNLPLTASPDGSQASLLLPEGPVTVTFDEYGRISKGNFTAADNR